MPPTAVGEVGEGVLPLLLHLHLAHIHHERVLARQGRVDKIAAIVEELTRKKDTDTLNTNSTAEPPQNRVVTRIVFFLNM